MPGDAGDVMVEIVLIGGGHANIAVLRHFAMQRERASHVRLTLISPQVLTPYAGMLPGFVAGHYTHAQIHIDLRKLCVAAGARFFKDTVIGLDRATQRVLCQSRPPVPYDWCSLNVGITPHITPQGPVPDDTALVGHMSTAVKPISTFTARWQKVLEMVLDQGPDQAHLQAITVVGGGAGGVELALALRHRLGESVPVSLRLLSLLPTHPRLVQRLVGWHLQRCGIRCERNTDASQALSNEREPSTTTFTLWATQARAPAWLVDTGLTLHEGFIPITPTLQNPQDPRVFAAGDCAHFLAHPLPKAGVYAVRMGQVLACNLAQITQRGSAPPPRLKAYRPQRRVLSLISLGGKQALISHPWWAWLNGLIPPAWVWRWKDRIDRRWMAMYQRIR